MYNSKDIPPLVRRRGVPRPPNKISRYQPNYAASQLAYNSFGEGEARLEKIVAIIEEQWQEGLLKNRKKKDPLDKEDTKPSTAVMLRSLVDLLESTYFEELMPGGSGGQALNLAQITTSRCFLVLRALNTWISELYTERQLPQQVLVLSTFYKVFVSALKQKITKDQETTVQDTLKMQIAYAYFLNTMGLISMRIKQYRRAIQWLQELARVHSGLDVGGGTSQPVFATGFSNLSTLYALIGHFDKAEQYTQKAFKVCNDLARQQELMPNSASLSQQFKTLLAHVSANAASLFQRTAKASQISTSLKKLIFQGDVKLNQAKNWYVRYYLARNIGSKKVAGALFGTDNQEDLPLTFQKVFGVNVSQLRFAEDRFGSSGETALFSSVNKANSNLLNSSIQLDSRLRNKILLPSLPNHNNSVNIGTASMAELNANNKYFDQKPQGNQTDRYHRQAVDSEQEIHRSSSTPKSPKRNQSPQINALTQQNLELKGHIQTLLDALVQRQANSEKVLQSLILPKAPAAINSTSSNQAHPNNINPSIPASVTTTPKNQQPKSSNPISTIASTSPTGTQNNNGINAEKLFSEHNFPPMTPLNSSEQQVSTTRWTFKNLRFNIEFYEQGVKIKSFSGNGEVLDWVTLKEILHRLQLIELFDLNSERNQHQVARILFQYLTLERKTLKLHTHPIPTFEILRSPKYDHRFYFWAYREFKLFMKSRYDCKGFIVECVMCRKSFSRYFAMLKNDQYSQEIWAKHVGFGRSNQKREFFVEVIKLKDQESLVKDIEDVVTKAQNCIDRYSDEKVGFAAIFLHFDSLEDSSSFLGTFYWLSWDDQISKITLNAHSLESWNLEVVHTIPYTFVHSEYGLDFKRLSPDDRRPILRYLCELHPVTCTSLNIGGKQHPIISISPMLVQVIRYRRIFINQKYMRPFTCSLVGFKGRCHGLKLSFYNQAQLQQDSMFVLCADKFTSEQQGRQEDWQSHHLYRLLGRLDLKQLFERWRKRDQSAGPLQLVSLERFMDQFVN